MILTGGGSMREELVVVDPPRSFGYRLSEVHGAMGPLVEHVEGEWSFRRPEPVPRSRGGGPSTHAPV